MSSRQADALHPGEHLDQRHLDLAQQLLDPELHEPRTLPLGELAREPRVDGRIARPPRPPRRRASAARRRRPGRRRGEPLVGGELVRARRCAAPGRSGRRRPSCRGRGRGPRAATRRAGPAATVAAHRLDVVADRGCGRRVRRQSRQVGGVARDHLRAVAAGPAPAAHLDRDRTRRPGRRSSPPRPRPRSSPRPCGRARPPPTRHRAAGSPRGARTRSPRRGASSGPGSSRTAFVISIGTSMSSSIVASCLEIRASSACSVRFCLRFAPEISSIEPSTPSRSPNCLQQLRGGLVADPGDARDVVRRVALEADEVGDQLRRHAVTLDHPVAVVDLRVGDSARGRHHPDPVAERAGRRRGRRRRSSPESPESLACRASVAITSSAS